MPMTAGDVQSKRASKAGFQGVRNWMLRVLMHQRPSPSHWAGVISGLDLTLESYYQGFACDAVS
jgi:hypothetical protein